MPVFYVADLNALGELREITEYDSATLERIGPAAELIQQCADELAKNSDTFEAPLTAEGRTTLRWRTTGHGAGILTVRNGQQEAVSVSVLAATEQTDAATFTVLQQHLVRQLRQTRHEPAFDLLQIKQRPLLATITFSCPDEPGQQMVRALADRAFAAAYFRFFATQAGESASR